MSRQVTDLNGGRELTDLDLVEVSLVTLPMQPGARVHALCDTPHPDGD